ncbi:MAG TPA: hypothetical protein VFF58_00825 [Candidatus Nitrosotalea sp.]|nr:hypothetical protein [Candidatus Nitrosotalea sp.]
MAMFPGAAASVAFSLFVGIAAFAASRLLGDHTSGWYANATFLLTINAWLTALFFAWGAGNYIKEQGFWGHAPARAAFTFFMEAAGFMFVVLGVAPFGLHAIFHDSALLYASPIIGWVAYAVVASMAEQRSGSVPGHFIRGRMRVTPFRIG